MAEKSFRDPAREGAADRQTVPGGLRALNHTNTLVVSITDTRAPTFLEELPVLNRELCTRRKMHLL